MYTLISAEKNNYKEILKYAKINDAILITRRLLTLNIYNSNVKLLTLMYRNNSKK